MSGVKVMDWRWKEEPSSVLMKSIWSLSFMEEPTSTTLEEGGAEEKREGVEVKGQEVNASQRMHGSVSSLRRAQQCSPCRYLCILTFVVALGQKK